LALASIVYIETLFGANVKKFTCNGYATAKSAEISFIAQIPATHRFCGWRQKSDGFR
jgi:hypothetical protein